MKFLKITIFSLLLCVSYAHSAELITKIKKQAEAHPRIAQATKLLGIGAAVYYVGVQLFKAPPSKAPLSDTAMAQSLTSKTDSCQSHHHVSPLRLQLMREIQAHKRQKRERCIERKEPEIIVKPNFVIPNEGQIIQCREEFQKSVTEFIQQITSEISNQRERCDLFTNAARNHIEAITINTGILDFVRCEIIIDQMIKQGAHTKKLQKLFKLKRSHLNAHKIGSRNQTEFDYIKKFKQERREVLNSISRKLELKVPELRHGSSLWGKPPVQTPLSTPSSEMASALSDIPATLPYTPSQEAVANLD
ncbi:MAG TPA: hypothetical protein VFF04_04215 [Candidatus Babeliales bacterium]|nr:hypothetical protein [Candidatus Babeliales bacterium]